METNELLLELIKKMETGKIVFDKRIIPNSDIVDFQLVNTETDEVVFIWTINEHPESEEDQVFEYRKELNKDFKKKYETRT